MDHCLYPWDPSSRIRKEFYDVQQDKLEYCTITIPDPNNVFIWNARINGPPDSPYEGGRFILAIRFPEDFPRSPPAVIFETSIFHPNITEYGEICLDILRNGWTPRITIAKSRFWVPSVSSPFLVVLSILSLMAFPMAENAVNPQIAIMMENSRTKFETMAREWTIRYAWFAESRPEQSTPSASANSEKGKKSKESKKNAAYHLHDRAFVDTIVGVVVYAVVATVLSMDLIGLCLIGLKRFGFFAAALGESLLNDDITTILYEIVQQFLDSRGVPLGLYESALGAILVRVVLGVLAYLVTKHRTYFEAVFLPSITYMSHIPSDILEWSGPVALITCAMFQDAYAFHNLEVDDRHTHSYNTRQLGGISKGIIFLTFRIKLLEKQLYWHVFFNLWSLLTCLVVRALVVSLYINLFYLNITEISPTERLILAYGELSGAVALSLVTVVDGQKVKQRVYDTLVTSALFTMLLTVGVMGLTKQPLVKILHVKLALRKTQRGND
ncbi:Ubiquitin-conjugating enzyme E2 [Echinococcus granulosus]|uniref:Ubiquitin-conjugating enzyme E2 n=1 Tax=Echinococcus granulosus TaxID=6210 RepID=W6V294_ECHGR|nr:Ubiquitin-conjugating enzyme E2 [Echinococcus granulosus]EUB59999.1 Ubiquitin-conjugating enzyme E2 [Echinococcus granulosus]